jgi:hypothetical protein
MQLTLTDGSNVYDISDRNPNADGKSFVLSDEGTYEFTLTATSVNGSRQKSAEVRVVGRPSVTLLASSPEYDGIDPVTLSWTSENAHAGLVLYEVSPGGQLVELYEVPEAERASGSFDVEPSRDTTYRIVADNGVGSTASAQVVVSIGPPVILSFEANPVEVLAGDDVTLSWTTRFTDEVELDIPGLPMLVSEVQGDPFTDISSTGTSLALTQDCAWDPFWIWPWDAEDEGCATIAFPSGFTFPFGGASHSSIRAYANGSLSFDFTNEWATYFNEAFPSLQPLHIAPFWDDLYLDGIWYQFGSDAGGQYLIVQWEGLSVDADDFGSLATVEFQAVLREDGTFTFRYGNMIGQDSLGQVFANGGSATIGYQTPSGSTWVNFHVGAEGFDFGQPVAGGLSGRTWRFANLTGLPPNGSTTIQPGEDTTVTLKAIGPKGETTATLDVVVHQPVEVEAVPPAEEPQAGWPFTVGWETEHATSVEVLDDQNTVLCTSAPGEVEAGGCSITEATPGLYDYVVRAHGPLGQVVDVPLTVQVFPTFVVETFEASANSVVLGDSVTLTWLTHGAVAIELTANGVDILPAGASPTSGSVVHTPTRTTTYEFIASSADGRTRTREITVDVSTVELQASVSANSVSVGDPVTLSWDATPVSTGTPSLYLPMREVASTYTDISTHPDAVELIGAGEDDAVVAHTFANGFQFPWGGELHSQVIVFVPGYVSFDPSADWEFSPEPFPDSSTDYVHIAPFWDDLHTQASGRVHALAQSDGSYVIQWSHVSRFWGSDTTNEYDLNFQLVLFPDGAFEFRYGTMAPPPQPFDFFCTDGDCALDAQGASASIGYQNPLATVGYNLHYGPDPIFGDNQVFPGGLDNRSFRKDGGNTGSMILYPEETTSYSVCAELDEYLVCKELEVEVTGP